VLKLKKCLKLSCWHTNKPTNRRCRKHPTFFATLRRWLISDAEATLSRANYHLVYNCTLLVRVSRCKRVHHCSTSWKGCVRRLWNALAVLFVRLLVQLWWVRAPWLAFVARSTCKRCVQCSAGRGRLARRRTFLFQNTAWEMQAAVCANWFYERTVTACPLLSSVRYEHAMTHR